MCGINGIISFSNQSFDQEIHLMNKNLEHRGPDGSGVLKFKNLYLGHTRLSIQDLSTKGSQPMSNDGNTWIIYNGEIYNFKEIKIELENIGYKFYSETDTEVILNSYKEWGEECFLKFNGMWAFAILDKKKNELTISRDRYGVKPCYIFKNSNKFIFSSEIKPILSITNEALDPNKRLLREIQLERFFTTSYNSIDILEPGHLLKINLSITDFEKKRWWKGLNHLNEISPKKNDVTEQLKEKLSKAVNRRLVSDVKISTSLSGGLDSSIIFRELNQNKSENVSLNPFVVKYDTNITFDRAINFANQLGKNPIIVNGDKTLDIKEILNTFGSIEKKEFYSKQLELYKAQKQNGFKVSIDGHGADECLGGYVDNLKDISISLHNSLVDSFASIHAIEGNNLDKIIKNNFLTKIDYRINTFLDNFFDLSLQDYFYSKPNPKLLPSKSLEEDMKELSSLEFSIQSLYIKSHYGFLQWLLNKWDRASMRHSIEIRSPYLDWEFFQYALSIPGHWKVNNGRNKAILRDAYSDEIPEEIINDRQKQGLISDSQEDYYSIILNNFRDDKKFMESNCWDTKKILNDIDNNAVMNIRNDEIKKILASTAFEKGMENMLIKKLDDKTIVSENFNLLSN
tara:strand:- start:3527 stop:5407 length:1881 start_codon:yes stop_codon:yes gene_type:complete